MATWSKRADLGTNLYSEWAVSDGTDIYYIDSSFDIRRFVISTNTDSIIVNDTTPDDNPQYPVWFNNNLYFITRSGSDSKVYRWNGSVDNITNVRTLTAGSGNRCLWEDGNYMVCVGRGGIGSYAPVTYYTTTGSGWNAATWSDYGVAYSGIVIDNMREHSSLGAHARFCMSMAPCSSPYVTYEFVGGSGQWVKQYENTKSPVMVGPDVIWTVSPSEYTTDWVSFPSPSTSITAVMAGYNMPYSMGFSTEVSTTDIYYFDSGASDWTFFEAVSNNDFGGSDSTFIRMSDYNVYAIVEISGNWEVWERDEIWAPDLPTDDRMWIYKTENRGQNWTSRGVQT